MGDYEGYGDCLKGESGETPSAALTSVESVLHELHPWVMQETLVLMLLAMDSISTSIVNVPDVWGTQVQVDHALVADLDLCGAHEMGRGGAAVGYVDDEEVGFPPGLDFHLQHGGGVCVAHHDWEHRHSEDEQHAESGEAFQSHLKHPRNVSWGPFIILHS